MKISFGALAAPLHKQLDVPPSTLETEQKLADAITRCDEHLILTSVEANRARTRLVKLIQKKVNA